MMKTETTQPRNIIADLIATVEKTCPKSLIYCAEQPIPALEDLTSVGCDVLHVSDVEQLAGAGHFELGIVFDFLEHIPEKGGVQLLGQLRNMHCEKIWVAVKSSSYWGLNTMISLGFKREQIYTVESSECCTYSYDIGTYNRKREWNSPKNWANPHNWGKYWW